ncbi:hypothetical protein [Herbaspirillum huttiense]|uniref:hypothetical protein n=1 Tax=Herbaspirillum huttiense TaxID=863372 RepID=UPI002E77EF50|nr:hypothetical protein [Herbaspirillum huttiense]MEE1636921.1 hypothetical protein [Herbaspirillum huttiense NC40101]
MSFSSKSFTLQDLRRDFDHLLDRFRDLKTRAGTGASIESTKLWSYRKKLDSVNQMDSMDVTALVGIVNKYCLINTLFDAGENIKVSQKKLLDLLDGKHILQDDGEKYNHVFFELSMALRFAGGMRDGSVIDLSTDCDVIVHHQNLAIECKYLHSEKKLRNEFSIVIDQLERRLGDAQEKIGMVAVDLTNLVDRHLIFDFARSTFQEFAKNYELLIQSRSILSREISEVGILGSVIKDRNFINTVNSFSSHQAEAVFYRNFKSSEKEKLTHNKVAVLFQLSQALLFEYGGEAIFVPFRMMSYYINNDLDYDKYHEVKKRIHSLATGI